MKLKYKYLLLDLDDTLVECQNIRLQLHMLLLLFKRLVPKFGLISSFNIVRSGLKLLLMDSKNFERAEQNGQCEPLLQQMFKTMSLEAKISLNEVQESMNLFYNLDFPNLLKYFTPIFGSRQLVSDLKAFGYKIAVVTNPIWPQICNEQRVSLLGLNLDTYALITHSENMTWTKPSTLFYEDCLKKLKTESKDCLMIGDSLEKDGPAQDIGIQVFLLSKNYKSDYENLRKLLCS